MIRIITTLIALTVLPVSAQASGWFVLAREDGCMDPKVLVKADGLPRVPASPDDYAQLMRARGATVTLGLPAGFPAELAGRVVQVTIGPSKAPVFVREDVCRNFKQ